MTAPAPLPSRATVERPTTLRPFGWLPTLAFFGAAGALLYVATHGAIPALTRATGVEPVLWWFLVGGLGVFAPLAIAGVVLLRGEGAGVAWRDRLWLRRMDRGDWLWALGALVVIGALSGVVHALLLALVDDADLSPAFLTLEPLGPGRYRILGAWLPFWLLNILGEELVWRGVLLPRQEAALGGRAWLANALGWTLFHVAFGWQLVLTLLPILLILPWVVQRRRNAWIGVLIHAGLNGPGFLAVALGLV